MSSDSGPSYLNLNLIGTFTSLQLLMLQQIQFYVYVCAIFTYAKKAIKTSMICHSVKKSKCENRRLESKSKICLHFHDVKPWQEEKGGKMKKRKSNYYIHFSNNWAEKKSKKAS